MPVEEDPDDGDDADREREQRPEVVYPWARRHIRPLATKPDFSTETVLFWHIPKSGGSTAKSFFNCLGMRRVVKSLPSDIISYKEMGLVGSKNVDVIFSSRPALAIEHLFDAEHKARALAIFRHPVERLISKFYYLQTANWEKSFSPEWKGMHIAEWAQCCNTDNEQMVKQLAGKPQRDTATEADLLHAKRTIKQRFVVGLMEEMEESIHRFNIVMGIDDKTEKRPKRCMRSYFGKGLMKVNSNSHPPVQRGSRAWNLIAERNPYDIKLYEFVVGLFRSQKRLADFYADLIEGPPA